MTSIGTPEYMSPQVMRGVKYGKSADVWSCGLVFYRIVTLEHPSDNSKLDPFEIKAKKLELSDTPKKGLCRKSIALFKCIYLKMIVFDEKDRATAETLIEDEAFRDVYKDLEKEVLAWRVSDLKERNHLLQEELKGRGGNLEDNVRERGKDDRVS